MDDEIDMSDPTNPIPEVDPPTAHQGTASEDAVILDVRELSELQQISVPGALHIPLGDLQQRAGDVPRDRDVYVLCHVGQRSAMATQFLRTLGHQRVWNIQGGVIGWIRSGLPATWGENA